MTSASSESRSCCGEKMNDAKGAERGTKTNSLYDSLKALRVAIRIFQLLNYHNEDLCN